jgi:hypothetical protein
VDARHRHTLAKGAFAVSQQSDLPYPVEEYWRVFLTAGYNAAEQRQKRFFRHLRAHHRCKMCAAPFDGVGASVVRVVFDKRPSNANPHLCTACENFARKHQC